MACGHCATGCCRPVSCGRQCDRYCPCISMYPGLCTVFLSLVISATIAAVFGAYCFISMRLSVFHFQWGALLFVVTHVSFLTILAAPFLLLLSMLLWCVCTNYHRAVACKAVYVLTLLFTAAALAVSMAGAIIVIYGASHKRSFFERELRSTWNSEIRRQTTLPCQIQFQLGCHGFEEGDCQRGSVTQNFRRCGVECLPEHLPGKPKFNIERYPGCRAKMSDVFIQWNAILLAGATVAFVLSLVAAFFTCTSVSFEKDK